MAKNKKKAGKASPAETTPASTSIDAQAPEPIPTISTTATSIHAQLPTNSPPSLPSATSIDFPNFIKLAGVIDIMRFCMAVRSTHDGANLDLFWKRAFSDGRKSGYHEGYEEGYSAAREEFAHGGLDAEITTDHVTQPSPPPIITDTTARTSMEASIQTSTVACSLTVDVGTQTTYDTDIQTSPPHADVSTQTSADFDPLNDTKSVNSSSIPHVNALTQTAELPPPPIKPQSLTTTRLDWAEDAESLPIGPPPPLTRQLRDLSALRSSSPAPFSSLRRRVKPIRSSHQSRRRDRPFPLEFPNPPLQHPPPIYVPPSRRRSHRWPTLSKPIIPLQTPAHLDWESDPRLSDLSRALKALGWIRAL